MCLAKAFLNEQESETLLMDHIASIEADGGQLTITTLLGEQKCVEAVIQSIDFSRGVVILRAGSPS